MSKDSPAKYESLAVANATLDATEDMLAAERAKREEAEAERDRLRHDVSTKVPRDEYNALARREGAERARSAALMAALEEIEGASVYDEPGDFRNIARAALSQPAPAKGKKT